MAHCQLAGLSLELPRDAAECIAASRLASARGWQEMGPVDAWFALRLLAGVLLWESLFRGVALAALLGMRPKTPEARSLWAVQVPSYAVSTVHATLLSLCVLAAARACLGLRRGAGAARSTCCSCGARLRRRSW